MAETTVGVADRLQRVRRRHYECYLDLAKVAEEAGGREWVEILDAELANLRAAMEWGLDSRRPDVVGFAASLAWYWRSGRRFREGRDLMEQALRLSGVSAIDRINALRGVGSLAWEQGDLNMARERYDAARRLAASEGNLSLRGSAAADLGYTLHRLGLIGPAGEAFAEAVALGDHLEVRDRTAAMRGLAWTSSVDGGFELGIRLRRRLVPGESLPRANRPPPAPPLPPARGPVGGGPPLRPPLPRWPEIPAQSRGP